MTNDKCKIYTVLLAVLLLDGGVAAEEARPFMATGFKVCEVESDRAIIWTRLTRDAKRVDDNVPHPDVFYLHPETGGLVPRRGRPSWKPIVKWPPGLDVNTIGGAAPGIDGDVRVSYRPSDSEEEWLSTEWEAVDTERDFTRQILLEGLKPGTGYDLRVESRRAGLSGEMQVGEFRTAPDVAQSAKVTFTVVTGQGNNGMESERGFKIYRRMQSLEPSFFVNTGDILYYDSRAKTLPLARWHWQRVFSFTDHLRFHREVPSYFIKDDHDTWMNDCWPGRETQFMGDFTFEQGLAVFLEQVGMGERTYRTVRWGKDLQIWLVEGRDYRSANTDPDGPDKTIWGAEQKAWFFETVEASDATFKVLMSPTPVVGPDRDRKRDNHSNAPFGTEGNEIREFMAAQKNMVVVTGDRHWQYVSVDFFEKVVVPRYRRIGDRLEAHGIDLWYTDCDGDIRPLLPGFLEGGINCMFPFEVNASGHPLPLLEECGERLRIMGGVDKTKLAGGRDAIKDWLESLVPAVERGGYIPHCDHRCPPDVPYDDYLYYLDLKEQMFGMG